MRTIARCLAVIMVALMSWTTVLEAQDLSGEWNPLTNTSIVSPLFTLSLGQNGSYRAVNRDEAFCSFCAGGGPFVETGTYRISNGIMTVTIDESNAPNSFLRIGKPFEVGYTFAGPEQVSITNAGTLTFDWAGNDVLTLVQKVGSVTSVERSTWLAVKALFR